MLGFYTRLSALSLFLTLIPITFVIHIAPEHKGPLFKNVAILGGLLHFVVRGGGWYSLSKYHLDDRLPVIALEEHGALGCQGESNR